MGTAASVTIPEAAMFADKSDIVVQGVLYRDRLTDFSGYKPTVFDLDMYHAHTDKSGNLQMKAIAVSELEEEIHINLPGVAERSLACAFFNETAGDWEALTCQNQEAADLHAQDGYITCCTDHLTRFALVPAEYLEIVDEAVKEDKRPVQTEKEPAQVEADEPENPPAVGVADTGSGINIKYLVGCICALLTLVGTLLCLGKQVFAFRSEKRRYEQLIKDGGKGSGSPTQKTSASAKVEPDAALPTERALITEAGGKKDDDAVSPRKVISTDMPAMQLCQTDEDNGLQAEIPVAKKNARAAAEFMQIEDQGEEGSGALAKQSKKKQQRAPQGDVSPVEASASVIDDQIVDNTLGEVTNNMFDKQSKLAAKESNELEEE